MVRYLNYYDLIELSENTRRENSIICWNEQVKNQFSNRNCYIFAYEGI